MDNRTFDEWLDEEPTLTRNEQSNVLCCDVCGEDINIEYPCCKCDTD